MHVVVGAVTSGWTGLRGGFGADLVGGPGHDVRPPRLGAQVVGGGGFLGVGVGRHFGNGQLVHGRTAGGTPPVGHPADPVGRRGTAHSVQSGDNPAPQVGQVERGAAVTGTVGGADHCEQVGVGGAGHREVVAHQPAARCGRSGVGHQRPGGGVSNGMTVGGVRLAVQLGLNARRNTIHITQFGARHVADAGRARKSNRSSKRWIIRWRLGVHRCPQCFGLLPNACRQT